MKLNEYLDLYEMANVRPDKTGLNMVIYISTRLPSIKHGPRIKVSKTYGNKVSSDFFSISFNSNGEINLVNKNTGDIKQKDIERIKRFVELNLKTLLKLWYDEIDSTDAVNQFIKVD